MAKINKMANKKTIVPSDFRDIISIIAFMSFVGMFFKFTLGNSLISNHLESISLVLGGSGLLMLGKVFEMKKWMKDGIQPSEYIQLFSIVFGLVSIVLGTMLMMNLGVPTVMHGTVGLLALVPATFIVFDYLAKNRKK